MIRRLAALLTLALTPGCSLVLDPDGLEATRRDADAPDTAAPADTQAPTDTDTTDTTRPDIADTTDNDTADTGAPDTDTAPAVVIEHSGALSCVLDYRLGLTGCPERCGPAWTYVVDASRSRGVGSFAWTFEATAGYEVSPRSAAGARVELTLGPPECLLGGADMGPFSILARLSVDGGPPELIDLGTISVRQVTSCDGPGACAAP